jgi:heptaprenyl diphosphate synthase
MRDKHYSLAACLEMLHMATLIHDDVIDESPTRRGKPTLHTNCGNRNAVLAGDFLLSRCFILAAKYTSPDNALALARVIAVICGQEIEQNSGRYIANFSMRHYFRKIMGKSATLFALSCHIGASEAKAPRGLASRLRRVGYNIGMAFQIIDDILDYAGDPEQVRKPLGNDIREGLVTLPLICALSLDKSGALRQLIAVNSFTVADTAAEETTAAPGDINWAAGETPAMPGDINWAAKEMFVPAGAPASAAGSNAIIKAVRESGGIDAARVYAERYTQRALRELACLPACLSRDMLDTLTRRLLLREA